MADQHKNFAYSTVATAPSPASSGTSLVVASGDGTKFPAVPFNATVWPANSQPTTANAEIVRVTARSTDTLTITRAQESTSARSIGTGDQIAATVTAKTLTDIETMSLDAIAAANATAADWSNNSHKITSVTAGAATGEAAVYQQTVAAILTTTGDIVYASGANVAARRAVGSAGQVLTSAAGVPTWESFYATGLLPDATIAQTYDRILGTQTAATLTSGTLRLQGIMLMGGVTITSITFASGSTALAVGTHQIFGLYDDDLGTSSGTARALLRGTSDDTSTAWAASTAKTLNLTSTYTTTRSGFYYLGLLVAASTPPNIISQNASNAVIGALGSIPGGNTTNTGLTALPNPAAAPTLGSPIYGNVS